MEEIIRRHQDTMLTTYETQNITWKRNIIWASLLYAVGTPFYSILVASQIRKNPSYRSQGIARVFIVGLTSILLLGVSTNDYNNYMNRIQ